MAKDRKSGLFYGYVIALAGFLIMVVMWGAQYSYGVFFKPLSAEFGWTRAATSGAYSLFFILHGLLSIVTGKLNDRFGSRIVMTACGFLMGLGYLLMSRIGAIWQLYLVYGVILAGAMSGGYVPLVSTVARWFVKRRGMVTGIVVAGVGFGTAVMPPLATWLVSSYGWQLSYLLIGCTSLVLIILAAQLLKREPGQMGLLPYGVNEAEIKISISEAQKGFSFKEATCTIQFWMLVAMFICFGFYNQSIIVHLVPHATDLGISPIIAANMLSILGISSIAGRLIMGSAGDRVGNRRILIACFALMLIALLWLQTTKEVWMFSLFAAVFGFGYGGFVSLQSPLVADVFGLRSHGIILGFGTFSNAIGGGIGPIVAGRIFDITGNYQYAFLICAALSIIPLVLILLLRPTRWQTAS